MPGILLKRVGLCAVGILLSVSVSLGHAEKITNHEGPEINISKKLRRILSAEMNATQRSMNNLAIAIPAGHWDDIMENVKKMKEGYIMKKKLSTKQMEDFFGSLPAGYNEIDREFKKTVRDMITAAGEQNSERTNYHYFKLNESCIKCHSKYAKKRFPGFK